MSGLRFRCGVQDRPNGTSNRGNEAELDLQLIIIVCIHIPNLAAFDNLQWDQLHESLAFMNLT